MAGPPRDALVPTRGPDVTPRAAELYRRFHETGEDPKLLKSTILRLLPLLVHGEEVFYIALQTKMSDFKPGSVVLTNRRFMYFKPKLLGGLEVVDHNWLELLGVQLKEKSLSTQLVMEVAGGPHWLVKQLKKTHARKAYTIAREMVDRAREERRRRGMEEMQAQAGGVHIQQAPPPMLNQAFWNAPTPRPPPPRPALPAGWVEPAGDGENDVEIGLPVSPSVASDPTASLARLKDMAQKGLITRAEYDAKRAEILKRL